MRTTEITNYEEIALGRLRQQYKDLPNVEGIISSFTDQAQKLEDAIQPFFDRLNIDISEGLQLNLIGEIVGQPRNGQTDDNYRVFLKGKIATNVSEGTPEELISIYAILSQSTLVFSQEIFPASFSLMSTVLIPSAIQSLVAQMLNNALPVAVSLDYMGFFDEAIAFTLSPSTEGLGFGKSNGQGQNTSTSANKLIDSGTTFISNGVAATDTVYNDTDSTNAAVVSVDSETQLTLDADIFTGTPKDYWVSDADTGGQLGFIYVI